MKRDDSVFFFTLIDFLVQILFFGLAFYTVVAYSNVKANTSDTLKVDRDKAQTVTNWTWTSSIADLASKLHDLEKPQDNFTNKWAPFIASHNYENVLLDFSLVESNGGRDKVGRAIRALGKPSCLARDERSNTATPIAEFRLSDDRIEVQKLSEDFAEVSKRLGVTVGVGATYTLSSFRGTFQRITKVQPNCIYFVFLQEDTKLSAPRDAVNAAFQPTPRRLK